MKRRQKRAERNREKKIFLMSRDFNILWALARMGSLRTQDLGRLFFGSGSGANKRLRVLFDAGLIEVSVASLAQENVYTLAPKGKEALQGRFPQEVFRFAPTGKLNREHLHALNAFRISLVLAVRKAGLQLSFFRPEWELKRESNPNLIGLVPDALFEIEDKSGRRFTYALEVDLGTEDPAYFGKTKIRRYAAFLASGLPFYGEKKARVLIVAKGARRLEALSWMIRKEGASRHFLLGDLEGLSEENILTAWREVEGVEARVPYEPSLP